MHIRRVGHFVPENIPLMRVTREDRITPELNVQLLRAFDIGPAHTSESVSGSG
jgi:hypothetical protein